MKKILQILGVVFVIVISIFIIITVRFYFLSEKYEEALYLIVPNTLKDITGVGGVSGEIIKINGHDRASLQFYKKLGKFMVCDHKPRIGTNFFIGNDPEAVFVGDCEFENGRAVVTMNLIRKDNGWNLKGMNIDSQLLVSPSLSKP